LYLPRYDPRGRPPLHVGGPQPLRAAIEAAAKAHVDAVVGAVAREWQLTPEQLRRRYWTETLPPSVAAARAVVYFRLRRDGFCGHDISRLACISGGNSAKTGQWATVGEAIEDLCSLLPPGARTARHEAAALGVGPSG